jgi:hypothetical protein
MLDKVHKLQQLRRFLLAQISALTPAQLNEIPGNYNNNIIWNFAHLGAAVQSLCYGRAGLPVTVADTFYAPYLPGTKPTAFLDEVVIEDLKTSSLAALDQLGVDIAADRFTTYTSSAFIQQRYGVAVDSLDDALDFLLYHEGFHTGYILAMKKIVCL